MSLPCRNTRKPAAGGFTLVEVVASIVLMGLLAAGLTVGFVYFASEQASLRRNYAQAQKTQIAIMRIFSGIKNASAVSISADGNGISFDGETISFDPGRSLLLLNAGDGKLHALADNVVSFSVSPLGSENLAHVSFRTKLANGATTSTDFVIHHE